MKLLLALQVIFNICVYVELFSNLHMTIFVLVLLAQDGKNMKLFKEDPIKYMRYFIGVELLPDGYEIAQKVHDQYLNRSVSYDLQLREIEQVYFLIN